MPSLARNRAAARRPRLHSNEIVLRLHLLVLVLVGLPKRALLAPILYPLHEGPLSSPLAAAAAATTTAAHPLRNVAPEREDVIYVDGLHVDEFLELVELPRAQARDVHRRPRPQEQVHLEPPPLLRAIHQPLPPHDVEGRSRRRRSRRRRPVAPPPVFDDGESDVPFHYLVVPRAGRVPKLLLADRDRVVAPGRVVASGLHLAGAPHVRPARDDGGRRRGSRARRRLSRAAGEEGEGPQRRCGGAELMQEHFFRTLFMTLCRLFAFTFYLSPLTSMRTDFGRVETIHYTIVVLPSDICVIVADMKMPAVGAK